MTPTAIDVIGAFATEGHGRPVKLRDVAMRLGMSRGDLRALRHVVRQLVTEGRLIKLGRGRYLAPERARLVRGVLHVARAGYGFVHVDRSVETPAPTQIPDVFVPRRDLGGAIHDDLVVVRIIEESPEGRLAGVVEEIVERAHAKLLGIWESAEGPAVASRRGWVRPLDTRVALTVRSRAPQPLSTGMVVEVEVRRFPEEGGRADGDVVHVVGPVDDPRFDVAIACRKHALTEQFPDDVAELARTAPQAVTSDEWHGRRDFRDDLVFTIDPASAKDFDDAICVTPLPNGGYRLAVHIADVSHYLPEDGPVDLEAAARGTSVYFPGFVVPMIPHPFSSGICSLRPDEDRLVVSALLDIDARGRLHAAEFARGVIRSKARFTYPQAQRILDGDPETCAEFPHMIEPLRSAEKLARLAGGVRRERGSIDFDLPEAEILWTLEGEMAGIVPADSSFTHKLIEEFMLLANEAVATHLWRTGRPTVFRVHEKPDPAKLEALGNELAALGHRLEGDILHPTPQLFQRLLSKVKGRPEERIVSTLALRAMMLARYDTTELGHFGLALKLYTHFTSPIRRYPDLLVHRMLVEELGLAPRRERDLATLCRHASERERIAQDAEREVLDVKKARFMHERLGQEFSGLVMSVDRAGLWVELEEFLIGGFVPAATLTDDIYEHIPAQRSLAGAVGGRRLKLGDRVRVRVDRVDMERKQIDFAIVWPDAGDAPTPSRKALRRAPDTRARQGQPQSERARGARSRAASSRPGQVAPRQRRRRR